ncbi:LLM class flavin-dependent oxidoreductase [Streptomyces sp. NPDC005406]|uniref:LLM class flavin-dependent oxidoreductase n=1 Tax=Streptomyces sp. NPDC005406 TaxID=3155339 RepID=UPI0034522F55
MQLDELYAEKLGLLLRLRDEERVTWEGRFRPPLHGAEANPRPSRDLPVRVAVGGTPGSVERAGRLGLPMALGLIGGSVDHTERLVDVYRKAGRAAGHPDEKLTVGLTSHFYVGETQEQALEEFYPFYRRYLAPETNTGRGWRVGRDEMAAMTARHGALMVGDPGHIIAKILDLKSEPGVDRFLGQVDIGGMPPEMVRASIERFGDLVAPSVRHVLAS